MYHDHSSMVRPQRTIALVSRNTYPMLYEKHELIAAPPSWASTATWIDNALSLELPVKRASEISAELIEDKEVW